MGNKKPKHTVIMTGGGTAGHITPLLAIARELLNKSSDIRIIAVIDRGSLSEQIVKDSGLPIVIRKIYAGKYRRYSNFGFLQRLLSFKRNALNIKDIFLVGIGFIQSLWLVLKYQPDVVFSKGGYVSLPIALASIVAKKPIITHDSDSVPGLANRMVSRFAKKIAVGIVDSESSKSSIDSRVVFTGVPVSASFIKLKGQATQRAKENIGLPQNCRMLFVGGSTQGAKTIDDAVENIAPVLLDHFKDLHIVHSFGKLNEKSLSVRYKDIKPEQKARVHTKTFLNNQYMYAAAADLVITRAGATALAEYGVLGRACIVIPAEHLTAGHQLQNSKALESNGAAVVIRQHEVDDMLLDRVEYLLQHNSRRKSLGDKLMEMTPDDAAVRVANLILGEL